MVKMIWLRNPEKRQRIVLKILVKQRSFKNQENIKRKWETGNVCCKWEVSGQNRRVGISGVFFIVKNCMSPFRVRKSRVC